MNKKTIIILLCTVLLAFPFSPSNSHQQEKSIQTLNINETQNWN